VDFGQGDEAFSRWSTRGKLDIHLGSCRWTFRHAGINPGGDLINFGSRQEGALQRHLAKRADAAR
jgi:hypothetical protein